MLFGIILFKEVNFIIYIVIYKKSADNNDILTKLNFTQNNIVIDVNEPRRMTAGVRCLSKAIVNQFRFAKILLLIFFFLLPFSN